MNEKNLSSWWVDEDDDTHTQTCTVKDRVLLACTTVALLICAGVAAVVKSRRVDAKSVLHLPQHLWPVAAFIVLHQAGDAVQIVRMVDRILFIP